MVQLEDDGSQTLCAKDRDEEGHVGFNVEHVVAPQHDGDLVGM